MFVERKEDLIASLIQNDASMVVDEVSEAKVEFPAPPLDSQLSREDLRFLATITDEVRHLRKQWLSQIGTRRAVLS